MIAIFIPGEPVPFARSGGNGTVRFTPPKQRNQMAVARICAQDAMKKAEHPPLEGPVSVSVRAVFPVPASWSKAKRDRAFWKTSKPDLDNLIKLIKDSFNSIVWVDDAQVCEVRAQKVYGLPAGVTVWVSAAETLPQFKHHSVEEQRP